MSEGASGRSVRDSLANPERTWQEVLGNGVATAATALFTNNLPPADLKSLVAEDRAASGVLRLRRAGSVRSRNPPTARSTRPRASRRRSGRCPTAGHVGGIEARPEEYERRVIAFFDDALLDTQ